MLDNTCKLIHVDVFDNLRTLLEELVHCAVSMKPHNMMGNKLNNTCR